MAVVVAGLQVLGDICEGTEILGILGSTGDVPDFMLSNNILPDKVVLRACLRQTTFTVNTRSFMVCPVWPTCTFPREQDIVDTLAYLFMEHFEHQAPLKSLCF